MSLRIFFSIANARRVIKNSGETPESHAQDDRVWKQVACLGTKRSRRQSKAGGYLSDDTEEQTTPVGSGSGRKRPRLSTSPVKRSKATQAEVWEINTHPLFSDGNMELLEPTSP
jgi:hypothetical protein